MYTQVEEKNIVEFNLAEITSYFLSTAQTYVHFYIIGEQIPKLAKYPTSIFVKSTEETEPCPPIARYTTESESLIH